MPFLEGHYWMESKYVRRFTFLPLMPSRSRMAYRYPSTVRVEMPSMRAISLAFLPCLTMVATLISVGVNPR